MGGQLRNISGQTQFLEFKDADGKVIREEVVFPFKEVTVSAEEVAQLGDKLNGTNPAFILFV